MKIDENKSNAFLDRMLLKQKRDRIIKDEMFSDYDYINWLESFTSTYAHFSEDSWSYKKDDISEEDLEKVKDLHLLLEGIEDYCNRNYIYSTPYDFGYFYNFKYNNIGYEIGVSSGQEVLIFISRVSLTDDREFVDFNYIINNIKSEKSSYISMELKKLREMILNMYSNGIPLEAIRTICNSTIESKEFESYQKSKR